MLGNGRMADSGDGILEWVWRQDTHKEALGLVQVMAVPGHHGLSSHRFKEQGIYL